MYQSELKEKFIEDYMRSRVIAKTSLYSLFKKTEEFEIKNKKDCFYFNKPEVIEMFKDFKSKSVYVLLNYNVILKAYCNYLKYYHGLNEHICYNDISIEDLRPLVYESRNKLLTREDINDIEDQLYNWTDKAIIECLWEGLSGNSMRDIVGLESNMIDHKHKQVHFKDGRVFDLTDKLYAFIIKAFDENEYVCYGETLRVKKMFGSGKIYKERDNAHAKDSDDKYFRWVYRKILQYKKYLDIKELTMKNISKSGMGYYIQKGIKETGLSLKDFLLTEEGKRLLRKYNYQSEYSASNVAQTYSELI